MGRYVIVVGGMNVDLQGRSLAPFRPGDSNPGRAFMTPGGVGRNIAENLVRLGCRVDLVSVLAGDALSDWLRESCAGLGIGTDLCHALPDSPASQYICLLDSDGTLVGAVAAMDGMDALTPDVLEPRRDAFGEADLIVADANLPRASLEWLSARARESATPILLDTVSAAKALRAREIIGGFSMAKPNRAEAEALTGLSCAGDAGAMGAAEELRRRGVERVFLSLGGEGILYHGPDARGLVRPPEFEAVNLSGAGDAAAAALAWARLEGRDTAGAAACAVAAAALAASAWETVSPRMSREALGKALEGVRHEQL